MERDRALGKASVLWLLVPAIAMSCARPEPVAMPAPVVRLTVPQLAYRIISTNDIARLPEIVMSPEDFVRLMEMELQRSGRKVDAAEIDERAAKASSSCLRKARRSLQSVRDAASEMGLDWSSARLVSATTSRGPYDPSLSDIHLDIFIVIKVGDKRLRIKLDDCFFVNGHRRLADGFRLMRR